MPTHPTSNGVIVDLDEPAKTRTPTSNQLAIKIIDEAYKTFDAVDRGGEFIVAIPYRNHDVTLTELADSLHVMCNKRGPKPFEFISVYASGVEVVFIRR